VDDEKGGTYDIKAAASLGMREAQKKLNEKGIAWKSPGVLFFLIFS